MKLSILIPSRNEQFLARTIQDILEHSESETEVIALLDGEWASPAIPQDPRVNVIYVPEAIGQRAGTNLACKLARGKYVMKVDAHCSFDQGFDRKMIEFFEEHGDDITAVPVMNNLHAFDHKCYNCGKKWYQDAKPLECDVCKKPTKIRKKMVWQPRKGVHSVSYCFDSEPHFNYFNEYKARPEYIEGKKKGYTESLSLQGSCFMCTRENYWKKEICDESLGNWGNQGIEVALATWLTGGRVLVNHNTWYAHMFRTKADFGFPWPNSGRDTKKTKDNVRDKYWNNKHPLQIHSVKWLLEKFAPVPGWSKEDIDKLK